ncbi:hypothetical protein BDR07DRAFT_84866 [Suillus spraguei]|nr:hypothetical protein BDR07DRAFT_84866 [Suillus spraguei]
MDRLYQIPFAHQQLCHLVLCPSLVVQDHHQCQRALSHREQATHPLPRPPPQIPPVYHLRRCVQCIHGCLRPLMTSQMHATWMMSIMKKLMDTRKEEDMATQGKTIVASTVDITNRMKLATYIVWDNWTVCPRNTAPTTSLGALLLLNHSNLKRIFRKGNGLGRARLARRLFRLPHLSHPTMFRPMNHNHSHCAWPHSDYPLPLSHPRTI